MGFEPIITEVKVQYVANYTIAKYINTKVEWDKTTIHALPVELRITTAGLEPTTLTP